MQRKVPESVGAGFELIEREMLKGPWVMGEQYFQTGDTVTIAGVAGASADPNGSRVVTRIDGTSFSVPVNCATAGGTGGTATPDTVILGLVSVRP